MILRELFTKWKFEAEDHALKKIEDHLEAIKHRLDFLTGVELVKGLFDLVEKFGHFGEELHLAAQAAGITVENFQKLTFAASQSAISQEELGTSLKILSRHLNDARTGSEQANKVFRQAGFDPDQVKGFKNSQEALLALSDRFKNIKDPIQKTALAQELLGRNSAKMVGFLSQGSRALKDQGDEAAKLGLILGKDQVEALQDVEHALGKLFALFKAMAATIAANVAPLMEHMIHEFMQFLIVNREILQLNVENWLKDLAYAMGFVWAAIKYGTGLLVGLAQVFHMEGHIFTLITALVSLTTTFLLFYKIYSLFEGAFKFGKLLLSLIPTVWAFAASMWGSLAPILPIIAAGAALFIILHDVFAVLQGKPTWLGQFWDWLKSLDLIQKALDFISSLWSSVTDKFANFGTAIKGFFGGANAGNLFSLVANTIAPSAAPSPSAAALAGPGNQNQVDINAPITVNVPDGTPPHEVGAKVKEGISDHFSRMMRETKRSTASPVAY